MKILIGEKYREKLLKPLNDQGFEVIFAPENPLVDPRLASHIDLSAIAMPDKTVVLAEHLYRNENIVKILTNRGYNIKKIASKQGDKYPKDASLCAYINEDVLVHNTHITDMSVISSFNGSVIHVNQGYSKCTVCTVAKNSAITSDNGIAALLASNGWDVLKIEQGLVELEGYDYGFIGGASFLFNDVLYFTGHFQQATENEVESFARLHNKTVRYLTDDRVFDIGGAILI